MLSALLLAGLSACQLQERAATQQDAAAVDTASITATFHSIRAAYEKAYAASDLEAAASIAHPEMLYAPPGQPPIRGRDSIVACDRKTRPPGATINNKPIDFRVLSAEWVYELGTAAVTFPPEGAGEPQSVANTYLAIFRKTPEGWKAYRESISSNQPPGGS